MPFIHLLIPRKGKQTKCEVVGHLDDFCPICRGVTEFLVRNYFTQHTTTVAGLKLEEGREGAFRTCQCAGCGGRWRLADGFLGSGPADDEEPRRRLERRKELEERSIAGKTTPEERSLLLLEPFQFMAAMDEVDHFVGRRDGAIAGGCLGTVAFALLWFLVLGPLVGGKHQQSGGDWLLLVLPLLLFGVIATLWLVFTERRRYIRRELEVLIARSLKPLGPSKQELEETVDQYRALNSNLGAFLDGARIHDRIRGVIR